MRDCIVLNRHQKIPKDVGLSVLGRFGLCRTGRVCLKYIYIADSHACGCYRVALSRRGRVRMRARLSTFSSSRSCAF